MKVRSGCFRLVIPGFPTSEQELSTDAERPSVGCRGATGCGIAPKSGDRLRTLQGPVRSMNTSSRSAGSTNPAPKPKTVDPITDPTMRLLVDVAGLEVAFGMVKTQEALEDG